MRNLLLILVVLAAFACESKKAAAPPQSAPAEQAPPADDLRRFLDGMLVTSNVKPPKEPVWPVESQSRQLYWVMPSFKKLFGIKSEAELRAYVDHPPEELTRSQAWSIERLGDLPTALSIWKRMLGEDPLDLDAAVEVAFLENVLNGPNEALAAIAGTSGKTAEIRDSRGVTNPGTLEQQRCSMLLRIGKLEEARVACNLALELSERSGGRHLALVLLSQGKLKPGLTQAELVAKSPKGTQGPLPAFTLGLAQQLNGMEDAAMATWTQALGNWPDDALLLQAVGGKKQSLKAWIDEENARELLLSGQNMARAGHYYLELGMEERAKTCFAASERIEPGPSTAHQLVHLGESNPDEALTRVRVAVEKVPHLDLKTALAWVLLKKGDVKEASVWVDEALEVAPRDPRAMSLKWQVCGAQRDYLCVIEYRKRLGLPTHFNVEQYRDISKAWQEQAEKNGVGLAEKEADSATSPRPPHIDELVLVPLADRVPPELEGAAAFLTSQLPGVKVSVGPREAVPSGALTSLRRRLDWEELWPRLREDPGRIYVVEQDLFAVGGGRFAFVRIDLEHGRAVVSLSRLRSLVGEQTAPGTTPDDAVLPAVQVRLRSALVSTAARLLGAPFPCDSSSCALHPQRSVKDFTLNAPALCDKHRAALSSPRAQAPPGQ